MPLNINSLKDRVKALEQQKRKGKLITFVDDGSPDAKEKLAKLEEENGPNCNYLILTLEKKRISHV
jgi:GT2 family glycosyltransferase